MRPDDLDAAGRQTYGAGHESCFFLDRYRSCARSCGSHGSARPNDHHAERRDFRTPATETVQTTETVRTIRPLRPHARQVVTTRTVTRQIVPTTTVVTRTVPATQPLYDEAVEAPIADSPQPLYDTVAAPVDDGAYRCSRLWSARLWSHGCSRLSLCL